MKRDPLAVLHRIRDAAVTQAKRELAAGLHRERTERQRQDDHAAAMHQEQADAGPSDTLTFATWLPRAHSDAARIHASVQTEQGRVGRLQQALTHRRTEAEAIAEALKARATALQQRRARAEQAIMDEAASRARPR